MRDKTNEIMASWAAGRNVLLYGPPATGKTRLISELFHALQETSDDSRGIILDLSNADLPFSRPAKELSIPLPVKVVWTTFHQSYGYEDFVLGLKPSITASGTRLAPWAGVFLDAALELTDEETEFASVVIFVDEINRGNAARIFGEFMTFLDFDYRDGGKVPLPVPLRQLVYSHGMSEEIHRAGREPARIPEGFTFPNHIYVVATMNSVDRAAVPIDSALARRFDRIEMRPDLKVLADQWRLSLADLHPPDADSWSKLNTYQAAYLMLDRLNVIIASDLGPEFELGHGLLTPLTLESNGSTALLADEAAWRQLAKLWDDVLYPQLEDRYSGRQEQLLDLLYVDSPPDTGTYAWQLRSARGGRTASRTLAPVRLSELDTDVIKRSFRWLTH
ncbi:AAA family ATPase [Dietzia maris]|uniref:AAA family ATPase n=1 Tax=Dietzia maris TaxID=37915 RepID=A0ABT8H5G3_9ACTN|nr:AAA family ATPase [Dietzia maris]MDN4507710.1 AAA family ATPase [Dietzia maris]